jgi:MFS family permease
VFVGVAAALQAAAALLLAIVPAYGTTLIGAALLGAGYGVFLSVDQALATQVLPDPEDRGKDLGIMNVALAVPQAFGPLVGAGLIAATGGFAALFVGAGVFSALGALSVSRVRGVR